MKLDKKQKVMLVLTICAFSFLGWQIYDLFSGGSTPAPVAAKVPVKKTAAPQSKASAPAAAALPKKAVNVSKPATETKQYMSMVDQLEMYRMQSQVLQQQLAIAKARQQIARVNESAGYSAPDAVSSVSLDDAATLRLSYIALQGGEWVATIDQGGRYQSVSQGDVLLDGSKVVQITKSGVTLEKDNQKSQLTFSGVSIIKPLLKKRKI